MELLKQATNSISNCKLIPRNLCGEGISIGSPVNMCTIGNKVTWPTGGVISHSLIIHPRLQTVLWCVGVFPRITRPVCGVPVVPVPCQSCWAPLAPCFQKQFPSCFCGGSKKTQVSLLASSFYLPSLAWVLHYFSATWRELRMSSTNTYYCGKDAEMWWNSLMHWALMRRKSTAE